MPLAEIIGYAAAAVSFVTYSMKTMIPLRISGIVANILFIIYGSMTGIHPTLILHLILLPMNCVRLYQMLRLVKQVDAATQGDLDMDWLKPFMSSRSVQRGEKLFKKGDPANQMFFVVSGRFRLTESGIDIQGGAIVGEFGLLTPGRSRTQTLECSEDGRVLHITYDKVEQLYFQNPKFGFFLLRLVSRRLFENLAKAEAELATYRAAAASA